MDCCGRGGIEVTFPLRISAHGTPVTPLATRQVAQLHNVFPSLTAAATLARKFRCYANSIRLSCLSYIVLSHFSGLHLVIRLSDALPRIRMAHTLYHDF